MNGRYCGTRVDAKLRAVVSGSCSCGSAGMMIFPAESRAPPRSRPTPQRWCGNSRSMGQCVLMKGDLMTM